MGNKCDEVLNVLKVRSVVLRMYVWFCDLVIAYNTLLLINKTSGKK